MLQQSSSDALGMYAGLHPDVAGAAFGDGEVVLDLAGGLQARLPWQDAATGEWLRKLCDSGVALDDRLPFAAGLSAEMQTHMDYLTRSRLLVWWYGDAQRRLLVCEPLKGAFRPDAEAGAPDSLVLSGLAVISYDEDVVSVQVPLVEAILLVPPAGLFLLPGLLARGRDPAAAGPAPLAGSAIAFLARCGFLQPKDSGHSFSAAWLPWEWWLHQQNCMHSFSRRAAASPARAQVPGPLPVRRNEGPVRIALPHPEGGRIGGGLGEVMDARRSIREPSLSPLTIADIGAVLWSVARYRQDRLPVSEKFALRNLPAGGGLGELEFYLAVNRCGGLERGFYFYDGLEHALSPVTGPCRDLDQLLADIAMRMGIGDDRPDCVVVVASRLARLSHKYFGGSYRLSLVHLGVAYEALYLAATALGLSPCATGFGEMDIFARLTGRHPFEETAMGEFAISGPQARLRH